MEMGKINDFFDHRKVRVRVRSPKNQGACGSACGKLFEVRKCVRRTVKYIATQRLALSAFCPIF